MNQPKSSDDNQASSPEPGIRQEADNSTFGSGQQAAIGNDNIQIQGNNNWLGNTLNFFFGQQTTPVGNPARPKNERILLAAVKEEVTARLRQSLHNAVLINLGKESQPQQVKRPWDAEIKIGLKPAEPLPDTTTILQVFDSEGIAGKLLILGNPGSGKTTTQLELAQALVSRAEEQPEYPVPVLFNLSSWKDDRQSLTDWLVVELKSKYGVSIKLGKEWVNNRQLLPLLDGLDELEPQRQELCVLAINQFLAGETRPLYLVVCSRIEEYSNYSTQLQLNGAIYLQPLSNNQICDYLTSINSIELWSTISSNLDLLELVKTPLLLSITVIASQEISVEEWQHLTSTEDRTQYLLDAYIGRMLTRDLNSRAYLKNKTPNARKTRMWLVWLAHQMQKEAKTEFLIEEMQPSLLKTKISKIIYNLIVWSVIFSLFCTLILEAYFGILFCFYTGKEIEFATSDLSFIKTLIFLIAWLIIGLFVGLFFGLVFGLLNGLFGEIINEKLGKKCITFPKTIFNKTIIKGLFFGLFSQLIVLGINLVINGKLEYIDWLLMLVNGLLLGVVFGVIGDEIKAIEALKFSFYKFLIGLSTVLSVWLLFGLFGGLEYGLSLWLSICLIGGLIGGVIVGFSRIEIENKTIPNQGIWQSANNTVKLSALYFLPSTILIFLIQLILLNNSLSKGLILSFTSGLFLGLLVGISRSGTPVIKHFTLRLILYRYGYIPWNYARFLNYCTERLFLQRVGGRYRFIHKLLQDHFAQMEFKRD